MANYVQKLARDVIPTRSFEKTDNHINLFLNDVYNTDERKEILNNPQVADVYATYAYDTKHTSVITDYDHYSRATDNWDIVFLGVADNAYLESYVFYDTANGFRRDNYDYRIKFCIDGNEIDFRDQGNIHEVHKAAMMYAYAVNKLKTMSSEKAYGSRYHNIKLALEGYFKDLRNYKTPSIDLNNLFTEQEMKECVSIAKASALKKYLIKDGALPAEKGLLKYPKTFEKFAKFAPKVVKKYDAIKQSKVNKAKRQERKALIKQQRKDLKLAKQKAKQEFKAKQEERAKSVKDVDFSY